MYQANGVEHKQEDFYASITLYKNAERDTSVDQYIDQGTSRHINKNNDWFIEFAEDNSKSKTMAFGGQEYFVKGNGNVQRKIIGKHCS